MKKIEIKIVQLVITFHLLFVLVTFANAENSLIRIDQFTDSDVIEGFRKTVFGSEYNNRNDAFKIHIKKFNRPIRLFVDIHVKLNEPFVKKRLKLILELLPFLNIKMVESKRRANSFLHIFPNDANKAKNYLGSFGKKARLSKQGRKHIENNRCSFKLHINKKYQIIDSHSFVFSDFYWQHFWGCLTEELFQSFGPINDNPKLVYSQFNDNNDFSTVQLFDIYILNMLYHPKIRAGTKEKKIYKLLPEVLNEVKKKLAPVISNL